MNPLHAAILSANQAAHDLFDAGDCPAAADAFGCVLALCDVEMDAYPAAWPRGFDESLSDYYIFHLREAAVVWQRAACLRWESAAREAQRKLVEYVDADPELGPEFRAEHGRLLAAHAPEAIR